MNADSIEIQINGNTVSVRAESTVLDACVENGVYVPHLCHIRGAAEPAASCRLCFVEIEGRPAPVTSCAVKVSPGMSVRTDTPEARRLQKASLNLLLSVHDVDCKNCPANRRCPLQEAAKSLSTPLKQKAYPTVLSAEAVDDTHPVLTFFLNRCVLCGQCIEACKQASSSPRLSFLRRGFKTRIGFYPDASGNESCNGCTACVDACPVAAVRLKQPDDR